MHDQDNLRYETLCNIDIKCHTEHKIMNELISAELVCIIRKFFVFKKPYQLCLIFKIFNKLHLRAPQFKMTNGTHILKFPLIHESQ